MRPWKNFGAAEGCVFFIDRQAIDASLESSRRCDEIASGCAVYAYVQNDPLNNTDPFGLDCLSSGGVTSCTTSAYSVNFPTPKGWQDFTSSSTNYHFYSTPANVGSANPATVQQWVANNPTPGHPSPATPLGTLNDATPVLGGVSPINISPVLSYTTTNQANGSPVTLNVTLPGHPLFPGIVVRQVGQTSNGTVINNYGEGTSALQSPTTFEGREFGPDINGVWTGQVPSSSQEVPSSSQVSQSPSK